MIEISQIFFQLLLFVFLTSFPFNRYLFSNSKTLNNINFFTSISINSLFLMLVLLFFSFFKISLVHVFYLIIFVYSILLFKILINQNKKINLKEMSLKLFFLLSLFCIFFNTSYQLELGWDGFDWREKANFFYNGGYLFDINKFTTTYQNYPHLGTYIWAFFWKNSFLNYEYLGRLFYNYFYIVSIFSIITSFNNFNNIKKIFLFIFIFICTFDTGLGGYQEYLIFSILSIFGASIIMHNNYKNNFLFYAVYLLSGVLLPWIKTEGIVYSIFLIITLLVYEYNFKKNNKLYLKYILSIFVILSILIRIFVNATILEENTIFHNNLINFLQSDLSLKIIITKIYYIVFYLINSFFKYPIWLLNLVGLLFSIYFYKKIKILQTFIVFFILNFLFIFIIYFTTSANLVWYLSASLDRLLLQTSGFYFVIFSLLSKRLLKF